MYASTLDSGWLAAPWGRRARLNAPACAGITCHWRSKRTSWKSCNRSAFVLRMEGTDFQAQSWLAPIEKPSWRRACEQHSPERHGHSELYPANHLRKARQHNCIQQTAQLLSRKRVRVDQCDKSRIVAVRLTRHTRPDQAPS